MNKIDISTDAKKKEVFELFNSFSKKQEIYEYFKISDNTSGKGYIEKVAAEIGFDFNIYKNRKKRYCLFCGKELKRGQAKFCSCSCSAKYNNEGRKLDEETKEKISKTLKRVYEEKRGEREEEHRFCVICGKQLPRGKKKYCSKECRKTHEKPFKTLTCEYCGKNFIGRSDRKYCCIECANAAKNENRVNKWKNGDYVLGGDRGLPEAIRNYLFDKTNYKCEECGFEGYNKKTGKTILQIHHIDGDSSNNKEENLKVLCPNCHAMTENFMALNKGNSGRKKRYKKGE